MRDRRSSRSFRSWRLAVMAAPARAHSDFGPGPSASVGGSKRGSRTTGPRSLAQTRTVRERVEPSRFECDGASPRPVASRALSRHSLCLSVSFGATSIQERTPRARDGSGPEWAGACVKRPSDVASRGLNGEAGERISKGMADASFDTLAALASSRPEALTPIRLGRPPRPCVPA